MKGDKNRDTLKDSSKKKSISTALKKILKLQNCCLTEMLCMEEEQAESEDQ